MRMNALDLAREQRRIHHRLAFVRVRVRVRVRVGVGIGVRVRVRVGLPSQPPRYAPSVMPSAQKPSGTAVPAWANAAAVAC